MQPITINLLKTTNCFDLEYFAGVMKLKDVISNYHVPFFEPGQGLDVGFQRQALLKRILNVGKRVSKEESISEAFIDCIHINIRSSSARNYVKEVNPATKSPFYSFDYSPDFGKLIIIDGQTRIRGAEIAYNNAVNENNHALAEKIGNIDVPISLSFNDDKLKEAFNFYMLNQHNAPLPANGGIALMKHGYEEGSEHFNREITSQSKTKDVTAYQLAERFNTESSVWAGEMTDFNESSPRKVSLHFFSKLIKSVLIKFAAKYEIDDLNEVKDATYKSVEAYWVAIKEMYPQMFAAKTKTQFCIMLKTSSDIMMKVFLAFLNDKFENEQMENLSDPETYKKFLKNLRNYRDVSKSDNEIKGQDVFRVGAHGAMGKYQTTHGKRICARNIYLTLFPKKAIVF